MGVDRELYAEVISQRNVLYGDLIRTKKKLEQAEAREQVLVGLLRDAAVYVDDPEIFMCIDALLADYAEKEKTPEPE